MACKEGQFDIVIMLNYQFKAFSIKSIIQDVNGMTHFDFAVHCGKRWLDGVCENIFRF